MELLRVVGLFLVYSAVFLLPWVIVIWLGLRWEAWRKRTREREDRHR